MKGLKYIYIFDIGSIACVRSDNGGELIYNSFVNLLCIGVYMGYNHVSPQTWRIMNIQTVVFNEMLIFSIYQHT